MRIVRWFQTLALLAVVACEHSNIAEAKPTDHAAAKRSYPVTKSDEEWKKVLSPEQYRILRESGTERAFTGKYWDHHAAGTYVCAACQQELFAADTKFDSGTG